MNHRRFFDVAFNREISWGHILTAGTMALTGVLSYTGLMSNVRVMEQRISHLEKSWDNKKPSDMEVSNFIVATDARITTVETRLTGLESTNKTQDARLNVLDSRTGKSRLIESEKGD